VDKLAVQLAVHAVSESKLECGEQKVRQHTLVKQAQEAIKQQQSVDMHFDIRKNALRGQLAKVLAKEKRTEGEQTEAAV